MLRKICFSDCPEIKDLCGIVEINGAYPGRSTKVNKLFFSTNDVAMPTEDNPCVVPYDREYNFSFMKSIFFEVTNWEKFSDVLGCKRVWDISCFYDGEFPKGLDVFATAQSSPLRLYNPASGIVGDSGREMSKFWNSVNLGGFNLDIPLLITHYCVPSGNIMRSDMINLQMRIGRDAEQGDFHLPNLHVCGVVEDK